MKNEFSKKDLLPHSFAHALLVILYIGGVAWLLSNGKTVFGPEEPKNLWIPVFMLTLFVLSATTVGALVLGRPIMLYLNNAKSLAVSLFIHTVGWLFFFIFVLLAIQPWK